MSYIFQLGVYFCISIILWYCGGCVLLTMCTSEMVSCKVFVSEPASVCFTAAISVGKCDVHVYAKLLQITELGYFRLHCQSIFGCCHNLKSQYLCNLLVVM
ncbi:hypothetical protein NP493_426g05017 [Ridgeia piscesae]|uniref:Uncharacterized protein n=1 Tax=Ridgeia piscesae TaxID=27915 RepID=A0AAD9NU50_RIDPI|nr:hypothetical protein NP493_426g05017 [Ridgeia piscesae]